MEIILLLTSFLLAVFSIKLKSIRKSPLTIFCTLWFLILLLYFFRLGLYDSSERTFLVYLIGIVSFFLGGIAVKIVRKPVNNTYRKIDNYYSIKYWSLMFLSVISLYVLWKRSMLALPYWLMGEGGVGQLKAAIVQQELSTGNLDNMIAGFIARPMQVIMVNYAIISYFEKKKDTLVITMAILLTLAGYICSGSKFSISQVITVALVYAFLYGHNLKDIFFNHKFLWLSVTGILVFVAFMMSLKDASMWYEFYIYACGCVPLSDQALAVIDKSTPAMGLATFNGVVRVLNILPSYFLGLGSELKGIIDYYFNFMFQFEEPTYIGRNTGYNAFVSIFSYFYADGRMLGVAFLSFLFGWCCSKSFTYSLKKPSVCSISIVLLLCVFISQSMVRIKTFYAPDVMALLLVIFLFPRNSIQSKPWQLKEIK